MIIGDFNVSIIFQDGTLIDDLENFEPIPLIDAVIPEALAARTAIFHSAVQNSDAAKDLGLSNVESMDVDTQIDNQVVLNGHESEVFSCTWNSTSRILATGLVIIMYVDLKIFGSNDLQLGFFDNFC